MPHIPIPPSPSFRITDSQMGTLQQNILTANILTAEEARDIAEQQARMTLNEFMKEFKLTMNEPNKLKIKNVANLVGYKYSDTLSVVGVLEEDKYYEFRLDGFKLNQREVILLHRRQTDSGHYIMEYKGKTMWVTKEEIETPDGIIKCMQKI